MAIDPRFKMPRKGLKKHGCEKYILRKAFDGFDLLPDEVLWRQKEGLSDGLASNKKSWYEIIQDNVEKLYTDEDMKNAKIKYPINPPKMKEELYYRDIFNKYYPGRD